MSKRDINYFNKIKELLADKQELTPYRCKCCGQVEMPDYGFEICKICGWQDDVVQNSDPNYEGGANRLSLHQYKKTWKANEEKIKMYNDGAKSHIVEDLFIKQGGTAKYVNAMTVQRTKDWWAKAKKFKD